MSYESKDLPPFVRGDDWTIKLNIKDSNKQAVDITGYTYYMTLKSDIDSADPGDLQTTASSVGADATSGILYINFTNVQTNTLESKTYNYDIQQRDDTGTIQTLFIGKVKVVKDVTRTIA